MSDIPMDKINYILNAHCYKDTSHYHPASEKFTSHPYLWDTDLQTTRWSQGLKMLTLLVFYLDKRFCCAKVDQQTYKSTA